MHEIETRSVGEQRVLCLERRVLADELPKAIGAAGDELYHGAVERGVELTGPAMVIYHGPVTMDADGPIELCLPVALGTQPFGEAKVRVEPAHDEAYVRLTKAQVAYPEILGAYEALERWLPDNGKRASAPPREVMFAEWSQIGDHDPAVDVAWPYTG